MDDFEFIIFEKTLPEFGNKIKLFQINGDSIENTNQFYNLVAKIFEFPDYFGRNLDALYDSMLDIELGDKSLYLVINSFDNFLSTSDAEKADILGTLIDVAETFNEEAGGEIMKIFIKKSVQTIKFLESNYFSWKNFE